MWVCVSVCVCVCVCVWVGEVPALWRLCNQSNLSCLTMSTAEDWWDSAGKQMFHGVLQTVSSHCEPQSLIKCNVRTHTHKALITVWVPATWCCDRQPQQCVEPCNYTLSVLCEKQYIFSKVACTKSHNPLKRLREKTVCAIQVGARGTEARVCAKQIPSSRCSARPLPSHMWAHALKRWENDLARLRMSLCFKHSAYHAATWSEQKVVSGCCLRFLLEASVCRCQEVQEYPCLLRCLLESPSVQLLSEHVHACLSREVCLFFFLRSCAVIYVFVDVDVWGWWRGRNISGKMVGAAFWRVPVFISHVSYVIYIQHRLTHCSCESWNQKLK